MPVLRTGSRKPVTVMLLLVLLSVMALTGCTYMFAKDYLVISDHQDNYTEFLPDSSVQVVSNYSAMKNAVLNLVGSVSEQGYIQTKNYLGDVPDDISRACYEVTKESPFGAYAVDYIAHDLTPILSYYEVQIFITYKRTKEEIESIIRVNSAPAMYEQLDAAIKKCKTSIAFLQVSTKIDKEMILRHVDGFYRKNPGLVYTLPEMAIYLYPEGETVQKIIEIKLAYPLRPEEIEKRMNDLNAAAYLIASNHRELKDDLTALMLCRDLNETAENIVLDRDPEMQDIYGEQSSEAKTAYGALKSFKADSEGYAMAYKLLCDKSGIECQVIEGRLNSEKHYWNIIKLSGSYYHVDAFVSDLQGMESAFLKKDSDMWGKYWWDTEKYDECTGELTYEALIAQLVQPEETPPSEGIEE